MSEVETVDIKFTATCSLIFNGKEKLFYIGDVDSIVGVTGDGDLVVKKKGETVIVAGYTSLTLCYNAK